ncbi:hypothetical protein [Methanoregula sp. PtaU1.Bin006]|uniref:hypothetical protein n=1 Tax=Methanoregula sp. PtaU1.Bin006 TaxID=1811681 RepID=UPI0025FDC1D6|nr:hypothetical protein [Methanoregula sp. PtaU1.Bin006]
MPKKNSGFRGFFSISRIFLILLFVTVILGFLFPVIVYQYPRGSDVFTHMYTTNIMSETNSLTEFYNRAINAEYGGYDYPFGMWYYGAIVMKVTGIDVYQLAIVLPCCLFVILLIVFYSYADFILGDKTKAIASLIFLLSMPSFALSVLNYSTSKFVSIFIITILLFALIEEKIKNYVVVLLLVFTLTFTHTGSFLFLTFFAIAYFLINALVWKRFDRSIYLLIVSSLFLYISTMQIFPFVQPQYIDKGRLILSISDTIANVFNLNIIRDMGQIFYDYIFVSSNYSYAIFWSCMLLVAARLLIYIHVRIRSFFESHHFFAFPLLSSITNISHGIVLTPVWIGPIHTILSVFGVFKLNQKGMCIALALVCSSLFPGAVQSSEGTGALREIGYMYMIIPVTAAAGLFLIITMVHKWSVNSGTKRAAYIGLYGVIIIPVILTPIAANLYYAPQISITPTEDQNLRWLSTVGNAFEGVPDYVYRERIDMYANKTTPTIPSGTEMKRYLKDLNSVYLFNRSEGYATDLSSFNIQYVIVSDRIVRSLSSEINSSVLTADSLMINNNTNFDRIYSSTGNFSVYKYITPPPVDRETGNASGLVDYPENTPKIQEYGSTFLIENNYYKVRVNQGSPDIRYLGTKNNNFLEEGTCDDSVVIYWGGLKNETVMGYYFSELTNSTVTIQDNTIKYKSDLKGMDGKTDWATLYVNYVFYEKAFKREVIIANDKQDMGFGTYLHASHETSVFSPAKNFIFNDLTEAGETTKSRQIFPSQDPIILRDKKISKVYMNTSNSGLYIMYGDTVPYPRILRYKGEIGYDYSQIALSTSASLNAGEPMKEVQYFALGTKESAEDNVKNYQTVTLLDYPDAINPAILAGLIPMSSGNISVQDKEMNTTVLIKDTVNTTGRSANLSSNAYSKIKATGLSYTECIPASFSGDIPGHINKAGYERLSENMVYIPLSAQNEKIKTLQKKLDSQGFFFTNFEYNIDTISLLSEIPDEYLFSSYVMAPSEGFDREGTRNLKFAYYQGNQTGLVLIPVTGPSSVQLNYKENRADPFVSWNETIISVINDGGIAVFQWNSEDLGNPVFTDRFLDFVKMSREKGITFTTPDEISKHYIDIQNISTRVMRTIDTVEINVQNGKPHPVSKIAYRVVLPQIDEACPYRTTNGKMLAAVPKMEYCTIYISTDLAGNSDETIFLEPSIPRREFHINMSGIRQGWNQVSITDTEGEPVYKAKITLDNIIYMTNEKGEANIELLRGDHLMSVEKEGFLSVKYPVKVKGWITQLFNSTGN